MSQWCTALKWEIVSFHLPENVSTERHHKFPHQRETVRPAWPCRHSPKLDRFYFYASEWPIYRLSHYSDLPTSLWCHFWTNAIHDTVSMPTAEPDDNTSPTIVQQMHSVQSNATIYCNPVREKIKTVFRLVWISEFFPNKRWAFTIGVLCFWAPLWYHRQYVYCSLCSSGLISIGGNLSTSTSATSVSLSSLSAPAPYDLILLENVVSCS